MKETMGSVREELQMFVRRFGLLNAACCDECCGEQVSLAQSHILFEVRRMGSPSIQGMAEELGMDVTTLSRQIKALEGKGLVVKAVAPDDRRVTLLGLTDEGRRVVERTDGYMAERLREVFATLTPFERETVVRSLGLLNGALAQTGCCGARPATQTVACCK